MNPAPQPLGGHKVLIVEDRYLIACEMADEVAKLGGEVVGPASDLDGAAELLADAPVDLALLDVNLEGEMVFPLAERLAGDGVPFLFLTGYDQDLLPDPWRDRPRLVKPVDGRILRQELVQLACKSGRAPA